MSFSIPSRQAGQVYKITVAVDNLGNIVWIFNLMPGTWTDVMIWDQRGPSRTHGQFFKFLKLMMAPKGPLAHRCTLYWVVTFE